MSLPYTIVAGNDAKASEVQGNFDDLDTRVVALENEIENIAPNAQLYDNGVFPNQLVANTVGTQLQYTSGGLIVNHTYYSKNNLVVDFSGYAADTYYVEVDAAGNVDIYTSTDASRTNLNTVVWNGTGFDSVTTADRNVLTNDQEIIDARGSFDSLDARLDDIEADIDDLETEVIAARGGEVDLDTRLDNMQTSINTNTTDISNIENGTTPLPHKITTHSASTLTIDNTYDTVVFDTSSNAITVTLPDASSVLGYEFTFFLETYGSGNDVTINCATGDTFDGTNTTATLNLGDIFIIRAVSANRWLIIKNEGAILS